MNHLRRFHGFSNNTKKNGRTFGSWRSQNYYINIDLVFGVTYPTIYMRPLAATTQKPAAAWNQFVVLRLCASAIRAT